MSDVTRYRQRAEQVERLADEMINPEHREQLLKIARGWRKMADRAELQETRTIPAADPGSASSEVS